MKLTLRQAQHRELYPHGYWYASTDDGQYDADSPDPLTAITRLVLLMENG